MALEYLVRGRYLTSRRRREAERRLAGESQPAGQDTGHLRDGYSLGQTEQASPGSVKRTTAFLGSWASPLSRLKSRRAHDSGTVADTPNTFIPCPQITFLIDQPQGLSCGICGLEMVFHFGLDAQDHLDLADGGGVPSVTPCGHVACASCMDTWLAEHDRCPFCRTLLRYRKCGHKVATRPLSEESVHLVPPTLPEGGCIPDLCTRCNEDRLRVSAKMKLRHCSYRFVVARERYAQSPGYEEASALRIAKAEFESVMLEDFYAASANAWLRRW